MRIPGVDAVAIKNCLNFSFCDSAILILVDSFESLTNIEGLVAEQGLSKGLNLTLLVQNVLDKTKEHHILDAALLLLLLTFGFVSLILLFFPLAFLSVLLFGFESFLIPAFTLFLNLLFSPESVLLSLFYLLLIFLFTLSDGQFAFLLLNPYFVLEATAFIFQ